AAFIILILLVVLGAKSFVDSTLKLPMPPISNQIDPYQLAFLRGGTNELARTVLFNLLQKNLLEHSETKTIRKTAAGADTSRLNSIETAAMEWIGSGKTNNEIFQSGGLVTQLDSFGRTFEHQLKRQQLLIDDEIQTKVAVLKWFAAAAVAGIAGYKILAAMSRGRYNVMFIVVMSVVGIILVFVSARLPRISKLGKAYLARLQLTFENLKVHQTPPPASVHLSSAQPQGTFNSIDPFLLSIGIFGGAALGGTIYDSYNTIFQKSQKLHSASCGAGCGDCGSSCSSSSCSSCSSCGGGCGGCGGCS
ncbi:MAG: TIGR04222 domain-containing membrane protein, partial [Pyrinomonadaceae bacterium]